MQNQNRVTDGEKIDIAMGGELPYSSCLLPLVYGGAAYTLPHTTVVQSNSAPKLTYAAAPYAAGLHYYPYAAGLPYYAYVPVSTSVWPPYGVYGKGLAQRYAPVASYPGYSAGEYGGLPVYDNAWGYSTPVLGTYGNAKLIDNGLWNYGGYGYGHTNKYWL
ncbi:hypothetical protein quinque_011037 [Culex quinquefasciatus]